MELQTISPVLKQFKISTRTLRYYEQIGLIQSTTKADYVDSFVRERNLKAIKTDLRHYGFNSPNPLMGEHLNYINRVHLTDPEEEGCQLDLLMPIKEYMSMVQTFGFFI